jgi:hypothetical protein
VDYVIHTKFYLYNRDHHTHTSAVMNSLTGAELEGKGSILLPVHMFSYSSSMVDFNVTIKIKMGMK